jgi:thioredoxin-related protein
MREEGRNPGWIDELQRRHRVGAFPTLVVTTPDGREIAMAQGYAGKQKLIEFLESSRVKAGASPSTR